MKLLLAWLLCVAVISTVAGTVQQNCDQMPSLKSKRLCKIKEAERKKQQEDIWDFNIDVKEATAVLATSTVPTQPHTDNPASESAQPHTENPVPSSQQEATKSGPVTYTVPASTTPKDLFREDLPECDEYVPEDPDDLFAEPEEGVNCKITQPPAQPEVRWRDLVFEKLISQIWENYQNRISEESEMYGVTLEPLEVDPLLGDTFDKPINPPGLNADLLMKEIRIHGLSTISLSEVLVTRSESLGDFEMKLVFSFDKLSATGQYSLQGYLGWFTIDSEGLQDFEISIVNATINPIIRLDTASYNGTACTEEGNVLITNIGIPLIYDDINFNFQNLGTFYNNALNAVGVYLIKSQETALVGELKKLLKQEINSLIC